MNKMALNALRKESANGLHEGRAEERSLFSLFFLKFYVLRRFSWHLFHSFVLDGRNAFWYNLHAAIFFVIAFRLRDVSVSNFKNKYHIKQYEERRNISYTSQENRITRGVIT